VGRTTSIATFIAAIKSLPSDEPEVRPKVWYTTQKQHWLGWLSEYHGPGAYGRRSQTRRDAEFAFNHIVEVAMLLWLIEASAVDSGLVAAARKAATKGKSLNQKSAAVRRVVPWSVVFAALWPSKAVKP
jgi:hypothetical protein